jgi:hypothetical protein
MNSIHVKEAALTTYRARLPRKKRKPAMAQDNHTTCKLSAVDDAQATRGAGRQLISRKPGALLLVAAAYILGGGGMLAWLGFLLVGPPVPVDPGLGIAGALLLDTFLCLLFFYPAQHHGPAQFPPLADADRSR